MLQEVQVIARELSDIWDAKWFYTGSRTIDSFRPRHRPRALGGCLFQHWDQWYLVFVLVVDGAIDPLDDVPLST